MDAANPMQPVHEHVWNNQMYWTKVMQVSQLIAWLPCGEAAIRLGGQLNPRNRRPHVDFLLVWTQGGSQKENVYHVHHTWK